MAKKLLLAEDSLTIQKVFALTFQQSDISLTTVDNGEDAVRLAGEISPDLVVADVTLPDRDGFDVATTLRGQEATRSCPILILAGSLPPFDEEKFRKCGADGVLFKPFESQELIDKVEALLRSGEVPAEGPAEEAAAGAEELWDFSDVLEEVKEETGKGAAAAAPTESLLLGAGGMAGKGEEMGSLGEFDVSLEEIAREEGLESVQAEEAAPAEAVEDIAPVVSHAEDLAYDDSPPAVTDLTSAIEAAGGLQMEETQELPAATAEAGPAEAPETAPEVRAEPFVPAITAVQAAQETPLPAEDRLREEFSDRAREILERVAAETVEKVMWEMMDRLSAEITEKIREAVEAVAWDVIPSTAESVIREEIERIRTKTGE